MMDKVLKNNQYLYYVKNGYYSIGKNRVFRCLTFEAQISYNKFNEAVDGLGRNRILSQERLDEKEMTVLAFYFDNMQGYARAAEENPDSEINAGAFAKSLSENDEKELKTQMQLYDACFNTLGRGVIHIFSRER